MHKENINPQTLSRSVLVQDSDRPPLLQLSPTHPHVVMDTIANGEIIQLHNEISVGITRQLMDYSINGDETESDNEIFLQTHSDTRQHYLSRLLNVRPPLGDDGVAFLMNAYHGIGELYANLHSIRVTDIVRYPALDIMHDGYHNVLQYYLRWCFRWFFRDRVT